MQQVCVEHYDKGAGEYIEIELKSGKVEQKFFQIMTQVAAKFC